MHYIATVELGFSSISHILRDVEGGWLLRTVHANGASLLFITLYSHIGRGIYYGSYIALSTWFSGILLLLLVMASAFLGYVLPWGQISLWGATVITNLFSAIPYVGADLVIWLWGGFSVGNPTLSRFFSLHFLIPFLVTGILVFHIYFLHLSLSNNPLGVSSYPDNVSFHWYYTIKDIFGFCVLFSVLTIVVLFYPYFLSEVDNFIPANPIVTPHQIVPEWYFLFAYSILRSVPAKLGGVLALVSSILILSILPLCHFQAIKGLRFYGPVKFIFFLHVCVFVLLSLAGAWPVSEPYTFLTCFFTIIYFSFYFLLPLYREIWDRILS